MIAPKADLPKGPYTLQGILENNAENIVPNEWLSLGAAECLRRVREMRVRNLRERKAMLERCATDLVYRESIMQRCAEDAVFWITHWTFIWNSDARESIVFLPSETQVVELIYPFYYDQYVPLDADNPDADKRNHLVEKPRRIGATWCILACGVWAACFKDRWPCRDKSVPHVGGVAADVVANVKDKTNPESHMGRLEQIFRSLPSWMLPGKIRPTEEEESEEKILGKKRTHRGDTFGASKISFPETKTFIVAKAMGRNVGRSVRFSWFLADEEDFAERSAAGIASLMDATACLWRITSVASGQTSFSRDMKNPRLKATRHLLRSTCLPWHDDAWLRAMKDGRSDADFRREILCDRNAKSARTYWHPPFDEAVNLVDAPLSMAETQPLYLGIDIGRADGCALLYLQRDDAAECVNFHGMVYRREATTDFMVPFLLGRFPKENLLGDPFPREEEWHPQDRAFVHATGERMAKCKRVRYVSGSDASEDRMHADSFVRQMFRMWGIVIEPVRLDDKREAIDAVKWMVPYLRIQRGLNEETPGQYDFTEEPPFTFEDVFYNYRKKVDRDTNEVLPAGLPVHDRFSNPADALQVLVKEMPRTMKRTPVERKRAEARTTAESVRQKERAATASLFRGQFGGLARRGELAR